jgi:transcriptional regulator with XRE-family HTH domain
MKPETLRHLRETRSLTREQLAVVLGCSAAAIVQWEAGRREIPGWVEEKMMRSIPVKLPLDELHLLLTEAQSSGLAAENIIAEAIRLWLKSRRPAANIISIGPRKEVKYTPGGSAHLENAFAEEYAKDDAHP